MKLVLKIYVSLYRLTNGSIGGKYGGVDVLLLTSIGRKTGKKRITPVSYMVEDSNYVVIASYSGKDKNPGWFHNIKSNKDASIRIKNIDKKVSAKVASKDERKRLWPIITKWAPQYGKYQEKTSRIIPIVILNPSS